MPTATRAPSGSSGRTPERARRARPFSPSTSRVKVNDHSFESIRAALRAAGTGAKRSASPHAAMSHLAIQESLDGSAVRWLEHVSDDEYQGAEN